MLRFVLAQLRGRPRRTLALLAGVLVATTGFTVLSAGAAVQRLQVHGTVADNARPAYDILVRPAGSRSDAEQRDGLVAPNYLSGLYGGITAGQLDQVRAIGNVEVAAPIAMLGHIKVQLRQDIDLTDHVDPNAERQLFRLTPEVIADRGLTVLDDAPHYVYLTSHRLVPQLTYPGEYADGTRWGHGIDGCSAVLEKRPDRNAQVCFWGYPGGTGADGTTLRERARATTVFRDGQGRFVDPVLDHEAPSDRLVVSLTWDVLVLAAAIDPEAEADLVGLDRTIVDGEYLTPGARTVVETDPAAPEGERGSTFKAIPALFAASSYVDEQVEVAVADLGADDAASIVNQEWNDWVTRLASVPGTPLGTPVRSPAGARLDADGLFADASLLYQVDSPRYRTDADGTLRPEVVGPNKESWTVRDQIVFYDLPPRLVMEDGFRTLTRQGGILNRRPPTFGRTGVFDPTLIEGFSPLSQVPLETYQAPQVTSADDRTRQLLDGQPLRPNGNPADYLASPPLVLTTLDAVADIPPARFTDDPISAVRVRVAGVTGVDERSRELVRTTAEQITAATGLDVDVTIGSSPRPRTVVLPAGSGGRPELTVTENWSHKGAAVEIVRAADRKSLALFGLILVVCTLFLGNAVAASVRDRRRELAVLTCLGWPARRIAAVVFTEVVGVGLVAGILAGALALGLADTAGAPITLQHALLALPVALGVAVLAAAVPAMLAARSRPLNALRPAVRVHRARRRTNVLGVALANLWRVPARTALGVTALAVGVGALTMLVVLALAFRDDVVGTLLGDAVALRVRGVDLVAAVTAVCLGLFMVADVLYINVRERAGELATLWATGWSDRALLRLVGYEGLGLGVLGGVTGSGLGLAGIGWFTGELRADMIALAAAVAAGAVVVAALAAVVPALLLRRLPLSTVLAEE